MKNVILTFDKKQQPMAFVTLEDTEGQAEAIMFSDILAKNKQHISPDRVLLFEGKVSSRNGGEGKILWVKSGKKEQDNWQLGDEAIASGE